MVNFGFTDRDANKAQSTFWLSYDTPISDALDYAEQWMSNANAISNGVIYKFEMVWKYIVDDAPAAGIYSDTRRGLLVLVENSDGDLSGLRIPSPKLDLFETSGKYAGIRLDKTHPDVINFATLIAATNFRTADNREFGHTLINGGLMT